MLTRWCGLRLALLRDRGAPVERLLPHLAAGERALADAVRPGTRRRDFVLGRLAAREAIRRVLGVSTLPGGLEVLSGPRGEPKLENEGDVGVSISHSKGVTLACAWTGTGWSAGIDIEKIRPTDVLDSGPAFSRRERGLLGGIGEPALAALGGWTLKESSWKAFVLDPGDGPEAVEIEALDRVAGRGVVRAASGLAHARVGRVGVGGDDYAWALAWTRRPAQNW